MSCELLVHLRGEIEKFFFTYCHWHPVYMPSDIDDPCPGQNNVDRKIQFSRYKYSAHHELCHKGKPFETGQQGSKYSNLEYKTNHHHFLIHY